MPSDQQTITKSSGVTYSERRLSRLAEKTFLSLWSYPSVYRDQMGNGAPKEVCDLLVVFENHLLIFSDKDIVFPNKGDLLLDWKRWYKKAIEESADQLYGAERWIKNHPNRLFIDSNCKQPFPINLPKAEEAIVHRIVVAHGASERCKEYLGGSGSLMINTQIVGKEIYEFPFMTGIIDAGKGYVHVFDDITLNTVMSHLDTVTDFVEYLDAKEKFLTDKFVVMAAGEEELLAYYLQNSGKDGKHVFPFNDKHDLFGFDEGLWEEFIYSDLYKSQKTADEISYAWDSLISKFNRHLMDGTRYYTSVPEIKDTEIAHRFLAREPRTRRRMLAETLIYMYNQTPQGMRRTDIIYPSHIGDPFYVFLSLPHDSSLNYDEYREMRRELLRACCFVAKYKCKEAEDIIGIAVASRSDTDYSEDLAYCDFRTWSEDDEKEAIRLQAELGLLTNINWHRTTYYEYPSEGKSKNTKSKKIARNDVCPCGSGKKYKKCCLVRDRYVAQQLRQQKH